MLAAVRFVEKFRSHLEGQELVLRVDKMVLKGLKTYSMTSDIVARWIRTLGAFKMHIEHMLRDKHHNADALSKKTELYENREEYDRTEPKVAPGFGFLSQHYYGQLDTVPWLDKDGREKNDATELKPQLNLKNVLTKTQNSADSVNISSDCSKLS